MLRFSHVVGYSSVGPRQRTGKLQPTDRVRRETQSNTISRDRIIYTRDAATQDKSHRHAGRGSHLKCHMFIIYTSSAHVPQTSLCQMHTVRIRKRHGSCKGSRRGEPREGMGEVGGGAPSATGAKEPTSRQEEPAGAEACLRGCLGRLTPRPTPSSAPGRRIRAPRAAPGARAGGPGGRQRP